MKTGTIIRIRRNIHNYPERDGYLWKYKYYKLRDAPFEIEDDYSKMLFDGRHFLCLGSDFWVNLKGTVQGFELLNEDYEEVDEVPDDLLD